ncbi:efflux RND transporter periplasmic adaptor subunit [Pseudofulvimonas gallinarii]|jgi:HlyD family secretion protein|uniref:HlyD family secretion protein n=1 Tax=Pseudofulvimonas gallinarii TaxID=634155 RepID=A0A4R3L4S5_9GAMM|nr:HlyD family efflux transporter periplasmic adaptor subunit [Pseudofulvimonas gallinarii]TCS94352.1 HlyD family secretion protein [Pseudofulvimonas gallinarii]THD14681.1 RND transporter [Pseudofulvimonas gallinarii]
MDIQRTDLKIRKRRQRIIYGVAGAIAVLAAGIVIARLEPAAPSVERGTVWSDTVKRGEMLREVRGPGTLVPKAIRWIAAETDARVERIVVKPGAQVEPDTVIVELSNPVVEDQLAAAQAEFIAAQASYAARESELESQLLDQRANFAAVEAEYEGARLQAEAEGELASKGIIPRIQYQRSQLAAESLKVRLEIERDRMSKSRQNIGKQLEAERARIEQLARTRDLRQRQADALQLRAGIAGVLQQVPVEEGQQVMAGTNLARVARPDVLMAELRIPETQAKDIAIGQKVKVDTRNGVVVGEVMRIDPAVLNGTVQIDVDLPGELPPGARPDLSVDGTVEIERLADVLYVGRPAFGQPNSQTTLFRIDADGRAVRVPVQLGRASVNLIEVVQGLQEGDKVILSDTSAWDQHDRLRLN